MEDRPSEYIRQVQERHKEAQLGSKERNAQSALPKGSARQTNRLTRHQRATSPRLQSARLAPPPPFKFEHSTDTKDYIEQYTRLQNEWILGEYSNYLYRESPSLTTSQMVTAVGTVYQTDGSSANVPL
eukprot:gene58-3454_t